MSGSYTDCVPAIRLEPGDTFAGYVIEEKLGAGGMGAVYKVRHPTLKKSFALKILLEAMTEDPSFAERFQREMETVSRLDHPNIVATVDGGNVDGRVWFTMNYVPGTDAQHAITGHPGGLPPESVVHIVEKVCAALDHAHRKGIVHRDIKPANILLAAGDNEQRVFLTDFGIAKAVDDLRPITTTGLGPMTIDYASPEQILGQELDGRTDVYSLGATMFVLLTGRVPFPDPSVPAKMIKHLEQRPPVPSGVNPLLPAGFDEVISRAMAKDRTTRYQHAGELASAARAALSSRRSPAATAPGWAATTPAPLGTQPVNPPRMASGIPPTGRTPPPTVRLQGDEKPSAAGPTRRRWLLPVLLVSALILTVGGTLVWINRTGGGGGASSSSTSTAATTSSDGSNDPQTSPGTSDANGSVRTGENAVSGVESPPTGPVPLPDLMDPGPTMLQGTVAGSAVTEPGYLVKPKNCTPSSQVVTISLGGNYDHIDGQLQLDDDTSEDTVIRFTATDGDGVLYQALLTRTTGSPLALPVSGVENLVFTFESAGQGSCDADEYLVFLADAIAHPRQA